METLKTIIMSDTLNNTVMLVSGMVFWNIFEEDMRGFYGKITRKWRLPKKVEVKK